MAAVELAQSYVHIRPLAFNSIEIDNIGLKITDIAKGSAKQIYHHDVQLEIRIEEGSIKVWATVLAVVASTYSGVANYKGFKESIIELCSDAKQFGGDVCGAVTNIAIANKAQVFRAERRLKFPGKVRKIIKELEIIEENYENLSKKNIANMLDGVSDEINKIREKLPEQDSEEIFDKLIFKGLPKVGKTPINKHKHRNKINDALKPEQQETLFEIIEFRETDKIIPYTPGNKRFYYNKIYIE
jgi:hypothetical protein